MKLADKIFIKLFFKKIKLIIRRSYKKGYSQGKDKGYHKGHGDGVLKYHIRREIDTVSMSTIDNSIYGPENIGVTRELEQLMIEKVRVATEAGILSSPSPSQWKMIFSDHPATCVVAGAGSGKSTTLILRLVFMHFYLNIPLRKITVISFTKKSCDELSDKLSYVFSFWDKDHDKVAINSIVNTFHSLIYRFSLSSMPGISAFDFLGGRINPDDPSLELSLGKRTNEQVEVLKGVYTELYNKNKDFKICIDKLIDISITASQTSDEKEERDWLINYAAERDLVLTQQINDLWNEEGKWPIDGIIAGPVKCFHVNGNIFYANGYVEHNKMPVFLSGNIGRKKLYDEKDYVKGSESDPKKKILLGKAIYFKNKIAAGYNTQISIFINSNQKLNSVNSFLENYITGEAPSNFSIKLNGELAQTNILELLYDQGSFIESLGKEVVTTISNISLFREKGVEFYFAKALAIFWPSFEDTLYKNNMMTFNRMFIMFSDESVLQQRRDLFKNRYSRFENLLVDEFQDISPQIANWIKALQKENAILSRKPTIMAIGDDWQSIYSWRGSSPDIFMNFSEFFPVHKSLGRHNTVLMMENYRSDSKILDDAEKMMGLVKGKIVKESISCREPDGDEHGVFCYEYDDKKGGDSWKDKAIEIIFEQFNLVKNQKNKDKTHLIVLSRTNNTLQEIKELYNNKYGNIKGINFLTIHKAKGLQGEVCVIFDDSKAHTGHILRNEIYRQVSYFNYSYDQVMVDESYRLAYVAITRGIKRVFWFAPKGSDGAFSHFK
ncbi:ATP-dependent DNA helicase [Buttiauxella gaviniae ATCC 51604]|uniref:ATP-dependent DNA helicase n=1 Tax=Buttiauxella gaviniae ATCC 51604 TaxID=1354253 RepID=A0A1B7HW97_9ENTR|nr:UvrD-helicase domain-containing protein [Buttiauxella gaviniae]OAT19939.1 ATP-dependent DNA helicase [Buttiauxella gaviniae ATCC 51604]